VTTDNRGHEVHIPPRALIPIDDAHNDLIEERKEKGDCCFKSRITVYLRSCPSIQADTVVFLLVRYDVGVFVCEDAFQSHSLDLLVLMAEQLDTEAHVSGMFEALQTQKIILRAKLGYLGW